MSKRKPFVYFHTLDNHPAKFWPGEQICYLSHGATMQFRSSLREIRADQRASKKFRHSKGWMDSRKYGYMRVRLPDRDIVEQK